MREVHEPVPEFNEKLLMSVERTLKRFKPNEPFERASWEIVNDWSLFRRGSLGSALTKVDTYDVVRATDSMVDMPEDAKLDMEPKDMLFR